MSYRRAVPRRFNGFDPRRIAKYDDKKVEQLLSDPGIIRNRLKITAAIQNAKSFLAVQKEFGSFDVYIWQFVGGQPKINKLRSWSDVQAETPESQAMSKDLIRRGFKFVGPTICYAFMQAVGMVNDHLITCFRYKEINRNG